jgi:hypothetical protein
VTRQKFSILVLSGVFTVFFGKSLWQAVDRYLTVTAIRHHPATIMATVTGYASHIGPRPSNNYTYYVDYSFSAHSQTIAGQRKYVQEAAYDKAVKTSSISVSYATDKPQYNLPTSEVVPPSQALSAVIIGGLAVTTTLALGIWGLRR